MYFERVTMTWNWAGTVSRRSDRRRGNGPPGRFLPRLQLADAVQTAAASAGRAIGLDHLFDARQKLRQ